MSQVIPDRHWRWRHAAGAVLGRGGRSSAGLLHEVLHHPALSPTSALALLAGLGAANGAAAGLPSIPASRLQELRDTLVREP